jgi:CRP-like cAMP-binding protein
MQAIQTSTAPSIDTHMQLVPLSEGAIVQGAMHAQTRIVERKHHLFCEGDDATHIFQVEAGHVCIYQLLADGRRQVIDFAFPGDFIGLGATGQHTSNAQATERSRLRCLPASELRAIVRDNPKLGLELYEAMSSELSETRELLVSVCQRSAQERVAGFLLTLSRRNAGRGEDASCITLPMTRTDIADYLGLTIETVSRTFSRMRKAGLIDIEQCIIITIKDTEALAEIVEGKCD